MPITAVIILNTRLRNHKILTRVVVGVGEKDDWMGVAREVGAAVPPAVLFNIATSCERRSVAVSVGSSRRPL